MKEPKTLNIGDTIDVTIGDSRIRGIVTSVNEPLKYYNLDMFDGGIASITFEAVEEFSNES